MTNKQLCPILLHTHIETYITLLMRNNKTSLQISAVLVNLKQPF